MIPIYLDDKRVYKDFQYPVINSEKSYLDKKYKNTWVTIREPRYLDKDKRLFICFCKGRLDCWCAAVFYKDSNNKIHMFAPEDYCYMEGLKVLYTIAALRKNINIDFFRNQLTAQLMYLGHEISKKLPISPSYTDNYVIHYIEKAIKGWWEITNLDEIWLRRIFYEFYYGLIAEDNKFVYKENPYLLNVTPENKITKVGHSIKFRGIQNIFYENMDVKEACDIVRTEKYYIISEKIQNWKISYLDEQRNTQVIQGNWLEPMNIHNYETLVQDFDFFRYKDGTWAWIQIADCDRANNLLT